MSAWLFQIQPRKYRIFDSVEDGHVIDALLARQHRDEIRVGDRAVLWIAKSCGYPAGAYAVGSVTSTTFGGRPDGYWADPPGPDTFVSVDLHSHVFHHPVSRDVLKSDPSFAAARILVVPNETSQRLSGGQFAAIERRVLQRNPTRRPTLSVQAPHP